MIYARLVLTTFYCWVKTLRQKLKLKKLQINLKMQEKRLTFLIEWCHIGFELDLSWQSYYKYKEYIVYQS